MTKRKPWPREAEDMRVEAIAKTMTIMQIAREIANEAPTPEVIELLRKQKAVVNEIRMLLVAARNPNVASELLPELNGGGIRKF